MKGLKLFTVVALALITVISCTEKKHSDYDRDRAVQFVDSLNSDLADIKNMLYKIDLEDITERKQYIRAELDFIENEIPPEKRDSELEKILTDYRGFAMMYENLEINIEQIVKEMEELIIQVRTLRQSVEDGDYTKDDFKDYLNDAARGINKLNAKAQQYLNPVIESDNMFMKRMEKLSEITEKLTKKKNVK